METIVEITQKDLDRAAKIVRAVGFRSRVLCTSIAIAGLMIFLEPFALAILDISRGMSPSRELSFLNLLSCGSGIVLVLSGWLGLSRNPFARYSAGTRMYIMANDSGIVFAGAQGSNEKAITWRNLQSYVDTDELILVFGSAQSSLGSIYGYRVYGGYAYLVPTRAIAASDLENFRTILRNHMDRRWPSRRSLTGAGPTRKTEVSGSDPSNNEQALRTSFTLKAH